MAKDSLVELFDIRKENIFEIQSEMKRFLESCIIPSINNWDIIVKINRKGLAVFDDLKVNFKELISINQIPSIKILYLGNDYFDGKNILLFDDSIRTGQQIDTEIKKIIKYKIKTLSVAVILARQDTIKKLEEKYPNIKFYVYKKLNETEYQSYFYKYMIGFFDYINKPLSSDLPVSCMTIPIKMSQKEIISYFSDKNFKAELVPNFFKYNDRFKLDVFHQNFNNYNTIITETGYSIDNIKIRLFVHVSDIETKIFIEIIALPMGIMGSCRGNFQWCFKNEFKPKDSRFSKKNMEDWLCLICINQKLSSELLNELKSNVDTKLGSHGLIHKYEIFEWAFVVEK